jgi:hypothetical protein
MTTNGLAKIDLNLLILLQVLIQEQNVSRAAERLHITQPAMSKTLSRITGNIPPVDSTGSPAQY